MIYRIFILCYYIISIQLHMYMLYSIYAIIFTIYMIYYIHIWYTIYIYIVRVYIYYISYILYKANSIYALTSVRKHIKNSTVFKSLYKYEVLVSWFYWIFIQDTRILELWFLRPCWTASYPIMLQFTNLSFLSSLACLRNT